MEVLEFRCTDICALEVVEKRIKETDMPKVREKTE